MQCIHEAIIGATIAANIGATVAPTVYVFGRLLRRQTPLIIYVIETTRRFLSSARENTAGDMVEASYRSTSDPIGGG
jgi:hypothetical protein